MNPNEKNLDEEPPPEPSATPDSRAEAPATSSTATPDTTMGMLCHLLSFVAFLGIPLGNILGPLVIWLVKKEEDPFADACGKESLNFQISVTIYGVVLGLVGFVMMIPMALLPPLGILIMPAVVLLALAFMVAVIVLVIIASVRASEGGIYHYPYTLRFIK